MTDYTAKLRELLGSGDRQASQTPVVEEVASTLEELVQEIVDAGLEAQMGAPFMKAMQVLHVLGYPVRTLIDRVSTP